MSQRQTKTPIHHEVGIPQKNKRPFFFLLHFLRYFLKNRIKPPKKFTFCWDNIDKTVQIQVGILTAF